MTPGIRRRQRAWQDARRQQCACWHSALLPRGPSPVLVRVVARMCAPCACCAKHLETKLFLARNHNAAPRRPLRHISPHPRQLVAPGRFLSWRIVLLDPVSPPREAPVRLVRAPHDGQLRRRPFHHPCRQPHAAAARCVHRERPPIRADCPHAFLEAARLARCGEADGNRWPSARLHHAHIRVVALVRPSP